MSTDEPGEDRDEPTGILRRHPTGPVPSIIRRHPTGAIPVPDEPPTGLISPVDDAPTGLLPAAVRATPAARVAASGPGTAVAAAGFSILNGWVAGVFATDLITGWWRTDTLFSVAVGFLTTIVAAATIGGVIALLLRRTVGRYLVAAGAAVTLLIFAGIFIAGAQIPWLVYLAPILAVAAAVLVLLPSTRRWNDAAQPDETGPHRAVR